MIKIILKLIPALFLFLVVNSAIAWDKGIYLTQYSLENPEKLDYFLREAKAAGLNTFVIDHEYFSSKYAPAIAKVKAAGIKNVTRVVVFNDGGNDKLILSEAYWENIWKLVNDAIAAGTDVIQLDYIRYSSKQPANPEHAKNVYKVIKWFKRKINEKNVPMEIDIFGEVSYYPSMHIGQDIQMFADSVDGVNPMVYPSHFWPYQKYSADPYATVNNSLNSLTGQFKHNPPFKVHAFIEAVNFHYIKKYSNAEKQSYLLKEIRAVEDAQAVAGWYVWSANNIYENLFQVLKSNKTKSAVFGNKTPFFNKLKPGELGNKLASDNKTKATQVENKSAEDNKTKLTQGETKPIQKNNTNANQTVNENKAANETVVIKTKPAEQTNAVISETKNTDEKNKTKSVVSDSKPIDEKNKPKTVMNDNKSSNDNKATAVTETKKAGDKNKTKSVVSDIKKVDDKNKTKSVVSDTKKADKTKSVVSDTKKANDNKTKAVVIETKTSDEKNKTKAALSETKTANDNKTKSVVREDKAMDKRKSVNKTKIAHFIDYLKELISITKR